MREKVSSVLNVLADVMLVATMSGKDFLGREVQGNGYGGNCWVLAKNQC